MADFIWDDIFADKFGGESRCPARDGLSLCYRLETPSTILECREDQSNFWTSSHTKAESIAAKVDRTSVARFVCLILNAGLGMSS